MIYPMYIDGNWIQKEHCRTNYSPATGKAIGQIPLGDQEDVNAAVNAAQRASESFAALTVFQRSELCSRIADEIYSNREALAKLLTEEHGKPYHTEALAEVDSCVNGFKEASEIIKWMNSDIILPTRDPMKKALSFRKPRGVYGVITPWNYPLSVATNYYIAPGLAAGNAIVWVPAPSVSAIASIYVKCISAAGIPNGVLNLVTGEGKIVGDALVTHPGTSGVGFTGGTNTGLTIASRAAGKPCLLELGGNGPSIVLEDADLDLAAAALCKSSFTNAGQICTSAERVLVHDSVADHLIERIEAIARNIRLGDPLDSSTQMGPVHQAAVVSKVMDQLSEAVTKGARIVVGGNVDKQFPTGNFVEATVVDHVSIDAKLNTEETFGPVLPIIRFTHESDLKPLINSSPFGLSAAIFSRNNIGALKMAEKMPFGMININEPSSYWEKHMPVGGKSGSLSGYGRCGGRASIEEMTEVRTVVLSLNN